MKSVANEKPREPGFKDYYGQKFMPMREHAERFMSECKLETFDREKVLNIMTAFALEQEPLEPNAQR